MMYNTRKSPLFHMEATKAVHLQSDQGLCCPLTRSTDTIEYIHSSRQEIYPEDYFLISPLDVCCMHSLEVPSNE